MMSKRYNTHQPEWEQILRLLEQGYEVTQDRFDKLTVEERTYVAEIIAEKKLKDTVEALDAIDLQSDWNLVKSHLSGVADHKPVVPLFSKLARYAAILLIPVALTVSVLHYSKNDAKQQNSDVVMNKEQAGTKKVMLILGDGTEVALDHNQSIKSQDGTHIESDANNGLTYQTDKNASTKAVFNTLVIPKGVDYKLILDDLTEIWLNSDSRIKYQVNFNATNTREVYLEKGEAYFHVAKNPQKPFIVHSATLKLQVLGTSFNVNTYSHKIQTTLVEGKVKVESTASEVLLAAGQQANYNKIDGTLLKGDVDVFPYVAWKEGVIVFQNMKMGALLEQLGRLYDYDIEFKDQSLKELHYTARADRSESLRNILDIIQETAKLKFTIKGRSVIVEKL